MKKCLISPVVILLIMVLHSCDNPNSRLASEKRVDVFINYNNLEILDSLVNITAQSNDSIFLGFQIGMTKSEYKNQIKNLKNSGKNITYSNSQILTTFAGNMKLGEGYTFNTGISSTNNGQAYTGQGQYFLEPVYNKAGKLMQLNILPIEKWDTDFSIDKPDWLKANILENSDALDNENLYKALVDLKIIDGNDFVRRKGNVIIYEGTLTVSYIDLKTLFIEMMIKIKEKEIKLKEGVDVIF